MSEASMRRACRISIMLYIQRWDYPLKMEKHGDCYSSVDGVVPLEPFRAKLLNRGARVLFDSRKIPGRRP